MGYPSVSAECFRYLLNVRWLLHFTNEWLLKYRYTLEPEQLQLNIDGANDPCSKQENLNFRFAGFSCSGRIQSAGSADGPAGVNVKLFDLREKEIASTTTEAGGRLVFLNLTLNFPKVGFLARMNEIPTDISFSLMFFLS